MPADNMMLMIKHPSRKFLQATAMFCNAPEYPSRRRPYSSSLGEALGRKPCLSRSLHAAGRASCSKRAASACPWQPTEEVSTGGGWPGPGNAALEQMAHAGLHLRQGFVQRRLAIGILQHAVCSSLQPAAEVIVRSLLKLREGSGVYISPAYGVRTAASQHARGP